MTGNSNGTAIAAVEMKILKFVHSLRQQRISMKYFFVFFILISATFSVSAQPDNPGGGIAIPRSDNPQVAPSPEVPRVFSIMPEKKDTPSYYPSFEVGKKDNTSSMIQKDEFASRAHEYADRVEIRQQGESNEAYKGNLEFGIIRTKSPYLVLAARDFGAEDGDRVKVTLNKKVIMSDVTLTNSGQGIMITLFEGFNDLRFEALNQGTSGPNTGQFSISDNKEEILAGGEWNLATGFHGKFIVIKE